MATAIAPSALSGAPGYRVYTPASIHNAATTTTEQGENPLGLADAAVAAGYVTQWNAISGSIASSNLATANPRGLVLDSLGGLHLAGNYQSNGGGSGGVYAVLGSSRPSVTDSTFVFVVQATAKLYGTTWDSDSTERGLCRLGITGSIVDIGINKYGRWCVNDWTSGSQATHLASNKRTTASTQVVVIRFTASNVLIQVYANGVLTSSSSGSVFPSAGGLYTSSFNALQIGMGNTPAAGWVGPIRVVAAINDAVSDSDAAGLAQWCLEQAGLGCGTTEEKSAVTLVGDSWFAGCYPYGSGSVAGFLSEMLAGKMVVDTIAVPGATAYGSVTGFGWDQTSPNRMTDLADLSERFPGHTISQHSFVCMLGINDSGLGGATTSSTANYLAAMASIKAKLAAIGNSWVGICTIPPAANSGGWAVAGANAEKNNSGAAGVGGIQAYNAGLRSAHAGDLIEFVSGPFTAPPSMGATWTDTVLEKLVKSTAYQINSTYSANSTRLTVEGLHCGRDGHLHMALQILRKLIQVGRVPGELSPPSSPFGG